MAKGSIDPLPVPVREPIWSGERIRENREIAMTREAKTALNQMEGRQVSLALIDGSRIDDCQLVLAGKFKLWVFVNGHDAFVRVDRVTDVWEAA
jgi:hypothetical protein